MEDTWIWNDNLTDEYSTHSDYHWLLSLAKEWKPLKKLGIGYEKLYVATNVQFFIWQSLPSLSKKA
jgi:hypothetical protein